MTELFFNIIFEGDILPGYDQAVVQSKLAKIFNMENEKVDGLFSGKQHKIKSNVAIDKAKKYIFAMAKLGAMAYMIPVKEDAPKEPVGVDGQFTETGSFDVSAYRDFFSPTKEEEEELEEESSDHKIFSFDEVDKSAGNQAIPKDEISGAHKIEDLRNIANMVIDQKTEAWIEDRSKTILDIEEVAKNRAAQNPDDYEVSGMHKIADLKEIGKIVKKLKEQ